MQSKFLVENADKALEVALLGYPGLARGYDDFAFSVSSLKSKSDKPEESVEEDEFLFNANTVETVVGSKISEHRFKIGAGVIWYPHVHWAPEEAGVVIWQLEYKMWMAGSLEPGWTTINTVGIDAEFIYVNGALHQIQSLPEIDMSIYESTAIEVKVKISRLGNNVADTYPSDARFMGFDFHVPIDQSHGSREVFVK